MAASGSQVVSALSGQWSLLREVDYRRTTWAVKVRCVRAYHVPALGRSGTTLEIVFHDQEGTRMHAQIKENDIPEFQKVIKEGKLFKIRNFLVCPNFLTFKTCLHKHMMQFMSRTMIKQISIPEFTNQMFNFFPFENLLEGKGVNENLLIDVIGRVVSRTGEKSHNHFETPRRIMELTLEDMNGVQLGITLWNEYVEEASAYLNRDTTKPVILIIQMARVRKYQGIYGISSAYNATKLIFDGHVEEARIFRESLPSQVGCNLRIPSVTLTPPSPSINQEIQSGDLKITPLDELIAATKGGIYWILGDIVSIDNYKEWNYLACENCNKKVRPEGDSFKCTSETCEHVSKNGNYRYKITVRIADHTAHVPMTLWDRECLELIGKPCAALRSSLEKETGLLETFPLEVFADKLLKRRGLFKVSFRNEGNSGAYQTQRFYSVWSMVMSPEIIEMYSEKVRADDVEGFWKELDNDFWDEIEAVSEDEEFECTGITQASIPIPKRKPHCEIEGEEGIVRNLEGEFAHSKNYGKKIKIKEEK